MSAATFLSLALSAAAAEIAPNVYYYEADYMAAVKERLGDPADDAVPQEVKAAATALRTEADKALRRGPYSVTEKKTLPPSGDKRDYISYSVYWWPDPAKADGLPWIRRDGHSNRVQRAKGDRNRLEDMINDVESLTLARYFFGEAQYGAHAAKLVRAWFLDDQTRMSPHLRYAQAVPGVADGRNSGVIDARAFAELLDCIAILHASGEIDDADMAALKAWFARYYEWLTTSELGMKERAAANNHGHWYAAQAARIALFLGKDVDARAFVENAREERLRDCMTSDGRQPEELGRTRSLHYSLFSLDAFAYLARYGESLGVDLWNYRAPNGASVEVGLAYAAPFVLNQSAWPYEQLHDYSLSSPIVQLFRMAAARYDNPVYRQVLHTAPRSDKARNFESLLFSDGSELQLQDK